MSTLLYQYRHKSAAERGVELIRAVDSGSKYLASCPLFERLRHQHFERNILDVGLIAACYIGDIAAVQHMIRGGADATYMTAKCDCHGKSGLRMAAMAPTPQNLHMITAIVGSNPSSELLNIRLNYRETLLIWACREQFTSYALQLIEMMWTNIKEKNSVLKSQMAQMKSAIEIRNRECCTPLTYACTTDQIDVVRALLHHGADPSMRDGYGRTPFMLAVANNHLACADLLLLALPFSENPAEDIDASHRYALVGVCRNKTLSPDQAIDSIRYLLRLLPAADTGTNARSHRYVNALDDCVEFRFSPLLWAADTAHRRGGDQQDLRVVEYLIDCGATADRLTTCPFSFPGDMVTAIKKYARWAGIRNFLMFLYQCGFLQLNNSVPAAAAQVQVQAQPPPPPPPLLHQLREENDTGRKTVPRPLLSAVFCDPNIMRMVCGFLL